MDQIYAELLKIPPVTRTLLLSTCAVTVPCLLKLLSPYIFLFLPELVLQGQVWRVATSFLYGGAGLTFLFDLMTLYRNSSSLEEGPYSGKSYDYAWHVLLAAFAILGINLPLSSYLHAHPLLLALVTLSSRLTPDAQINLMGFLQLPLKYLPYAMLGMDAVMSGPAEAGRGLTGVIVGLGWAMLLERGTAPGAPDLLKRWVGSGLRVVQGAGASGVVNPGALRRAAAGGQATFGTSGPVGGFRTGAGAGPGRERREVPASTGGHSWGTGRRLGD